MTPYSFDPNAVTRDNVKSIVKNIFTAAQPQEQTRWNEAYADTRFWAGDQGYISSYYGNSQWNQSKGMYFNLIQPYVNMVSGHEREHRKKLKCVPLQNSQNKLATQLTQALYYIDSVSNIGEKFSRVFEMAAVTGLEIMQPYLNFTNDCVNGEIDLKHWTFNSFIVDPYFKDPSMSDANYVITQEFVSKPASILEFGEEADKIQLMTPYKGKRDTFFYFLPENTVGNTSGLIVKTVFWYRTVKKVPSVVNMMTGEIYDYKGPEEYIEEFALTYRNMLGQPVDVIDTEKAVWECAVFLNDEVMYVGKNPLGFSQCPFVAMYWNYDWQIPLPGLRARSLVRSMRDMNWMFNRTLVYSHDSFEASINGTVRIENSLVNEDIAQQGGNGKQIIIKEEAARMFGAAAFQRLDPVALPQSNFELTNQLLQLGPALTGVNEELIGAAKDDIPGILSMARRGAGLTTLHKYFDQADLSFRGIGKLFLEIATRWWRPEKFARIFGEQPVQDFFSLKFQQYDVIVEEGVNTATQQNAQFLQLLKVQEILGPLGMMVPPDKFLKNLTIEGKDELIQSIAQQQQQAAEIQKQKTQIDMAIMEQQMQNLQADTAEKLGLFKERVSRAQSNLGLKEERDAEVHRNESNSLKLNAEAFKTLVDAIKDASPEAIAQAALLLNSAQLKQSQREVAQEIKQSNEAAMQTQELTPLLEELERANNERESYVEEPSGAEQDAGESESFPTI